MCEYFWHPTVLCTSVRTDIHIIASHSSPRSHLLATPSIHPCSTSRPRARFPISPSLSTYPQLHPKTRCKARGVHNRYTQAESGVGPVRWRSLALNRAEPSPCQTFKHDLRFLRCVQIARLNPACLHRNSRPAIQSPFPSPTLFQKP
jgi:hypothetical protein